MNLSARILPYTLMLTLAAGCSPTPSSTASDAALQDGHITDGQITDDTSTDGLMLDTGPDGPGSDALPDAPLCGITGQACCPTEPPCLASNAICDASNFCVLDIACGAQGQDCCDGVCNTPDLVCTRSGGLRLRCEPCGGTGEPCCAESVCESGGCCVSDRCIEDGATCISGTQNLGSCSAGQCQSCGALGEPCCPDLLNACYEGICPFGIDPVCSACGETGEPCCKNNVCTAGCCGKENLCLAPGAPCGSGTCADGSCGGCGALGEPCCDPHATLWCAQSHTLCDGQFCQAAP